MDEGKDLESEFDDKMCFLGSSDDQMDFDRVKDLVRESRFVCRSCGRSAANSENLCVPETL
jgi:hypothetical protein